MKKVLIGILILIPIIILLVVALVTNLLQLQAWIAVDDLLINEKGTDAAVEEIEMLLDVNDGVIHKFTDYVDVVVLPDKANNYSIEWTISNVVCSDEDTIDPAALVDASGLKTDINSSGEFVVNAYCSFNVNVRAETISKNFSVNVVGNTVQSVSLTDGNGGKEGELKVGKSMRLYAAYVPVDSIVEAPIFFSEKPEIATVDQNGVLSAKSAGKTRIYVTAEKFGDPSERVQSNFYEISVTAAAGAFGDDILLARRDGGRYSFAELGISYDDIDVAACENCEIDQSGVVVHGEFAKIAIKGGGTLEANVCEADEIEIEHADIFEWKQQGDFVLDIGGAPLRLAARYCATTDERKPNASWSTSDESVAVVTADGNVTGLSAGQVVITATCGDFEASVTLNVQKKISSVRLKTSDASLKVGLARETVFASERYVYATDAAGGERYRDKVANSVLIRLHGEPKDGSADELAQFYAQYKFEVEEGAEFARFDGAVANELVFVSSALEGKGKQHIKIKAEAIYPRFENGTLKSDVVTLCAIYGVEVSNYEQAVRAGLDQKDYANRPDLIVARENEAEFDAPNGQKYYVVNEQYSSRNYAITLAANIALDETKEVRYHSDSGACVVLFGDLYGNGFMISAKPYQVVDWDSFLVLVAQSGITVSNATLRHEDTIIDKLDSGTFKNSYCIACESYNLDGSRVKDIELEYCIFENSHGGCDILNADVSVNGCIFRNISSIGIYGRTRVEREDKLYFARLNINNSIFSSIIGPAFNMSNESYSLLPDKSGRFTSKSGQAGVDESYEWVANNLVPKRYVDCVTQTGFLDIYNWQNAAKVTLIDTGQRSLNELIASMSGPIIVGHPEFRKGVVTYNEIDYFHLGFMTTGINTSGSAPTLNEKVFTQFSIEDDRFFSIDATKLDPNIPELDLGVQLTIERILNNISVIIYCYKKDSALGPASTYEINNQLIEHLHS